MRAHFADIAPALQRTWAALRVHHGSTIPTIPVENHGPA
jgi:hypothetical protein